MRGSRSFLNKDVNKNVNKRKRSPFLGNGFVFISILIVIISLASCSPRDGVYRGNLSDASNALSKVYKDDVDLMKSYRDKNNSEQYDKALEACDDLKSKFKTFKEITPAKNFEDLANDIASQVDNADAAIDSVIAGINNYKETGKIDEYQKAFEKCYNVMEESIKNINSIFDKMKAKSDK